MAHKFAIVIPSYNNKKWCRKNVLSALKQDYENFRIIYTDDCSSDGTYDEISIIKDKHDKKSKITLIKNEERLGAMHNMYNMVQLCEDDEIVVVLDGDDWLANSKVLQRLSKEYDKEVYMTYGQYVSYPDMQKGCSRSIPKDVVDKNSYRKFRWCSSHLRTYYAWLFKKINKEDLMYEGKWLEMTSDLAAMFPMLEMSGSKHSFIPDVLYIYNYQSPINDAKVNVQKQQGLEMFIRSKKPYEAV
jgi:glycosyltransferase involved in cell wall biosynthesis